jgi:transcriptional regulator with XRE-family HTH domain
METSGTEFNRCLMTELRAERSMRNVTVKQLAERAGIFHGTLLRYLNNHRDMPVPVLYDVAMALDVDPAALVDRAAARLAAESRAPSGQLTFDEADGADEPDPSEVGRRIALLVSVLARGRGSAHGYKEIAPLLLERGVRFSQEEWAELLEGSAVRAPGRRSLEAIADVLGIDGVYLTGAVGDPEVVRIEAQLDFLRALHESKVEGLAARGSDDITPETLRAITSSLRHEER